MATRGISLPPVRRGAPGSFFSLAPSPLTHIKIVNNKKMCTHFFRLTTSRLCECGLTPLKGDAASPPSGSDCPPLRFFKLSCRCLRPCDFFHFYVLVYPSRGVVHFFYYRSEFQSRFCRVALKAGWRFVLHFCDRARQFRSTRSVAPSLETPAFCEHMSLKILAAAGARANRLAREG